MRLVTKIGFGLSALAIALALGSYDHVANAAYETGVYTIVSPVGPSVYVTSPPRYHDGCEPYTSSYYDSSAFDTSCRSAAGGDWSMDMGDGTVGDNVYLEVQPQAIDGFPAGGLYEVVAGDVYHWDSSANGSYQYFGIHTWNPNTSSWENFAWVVLGHINSFQYSINQVVVQPTTGSSTTYVAKIAPQGTWHVHLHVEMYNYSHYARAYNWHGPTITNDATEGPQCSRPGPTPSYLRDDCNAVVAPTDVVGYVGGSNSSFSERDNPYFNDF
jgi:hypothetical protein